MFPELHILFAECAPAVEPLLFEAVPGWVGTVPEPDPKTLRVGMAWTLYLTLGICVLALEANGFIIFSFNPPWNEERIHFCCLYAPGKSMCEKRRLEFRSSLHGISWEADGDFFILLVVYGISVRVVDLSMVVHFDWNSSEGGPICQEEQVLSCTWLFLPGQEEQSRSVFLHWLYQSSWCPSCRGMPPSESQGSVGLDTLPTLELLLEPMKWGGKWTGLYCF